MRFLSVPLLIAVATACSSAVRGPRQIPESSLGLYAFDIMLPDASARERLEGTYSVLADTVLMELEGRRPCMPIPPHLAEEDIRYNCGELANSTLIFSFDPRRPHADAWALVNTTTVGQRRQCVAWDRNGRCSQWRAEYGDITRTERIRLNAKKVM